MAAGTQAADERFVGAEAKRVGPGIWRITDDATGYDMGRIRHIAAGPDDVVWVAGHNRLSRLGEEGAIKKPYRVFHVYELDVAPDDSLLVGGVSMASYDGESWTKLWSEPRQPHEFRAIGLTASDGSVWAKSHASSGGGVGHWDGQTWTHRRHSCYCYTSAMAETDDGIWMGVAGSAGVVGLSGTGLFRLDGTQWTEVRPIADERNEVADMAARSRGDLWVSLLPQDAEARDRPNYSRAHLARWDGEAWTSYAWPSRVQSKLGELPWNAGVDGFRPTLSPGMQVAPGGTLWFPRPLMSFDGETWKQYAIPHRDRNARPRLGDFTIDSAGRLWLVVRDYTDGHPGKPDGIYVMDPSQADPIAQEAAVVRTPG
ncbi:MAG: hypothetical protein U9O18_04525, partial [Chloroflexota bacterium]|nr:hypothetical protein [Chloroflexota bacterium]